MNATRCGYRQLSINVNRANVNYFHQFLTVSDWPITEPIHHWIGIYTDLFKRDHLLPVSGV